MGETMGSRPTAGDDAAGDLAAAGHQLDRVAELVAAVRDMAEAVGELIPNTTDEDRARAVLMGQMALCDSVQSLLELARGRVGRAAA